MKDSSKTENRLNTSNQTNFPKWKVENTELDKPEKNIKHINNA